MSWRTADARLLRRAMFRWRVKPETGDRATRPTGRQTTSASWRRAAFAPMCRCPTGTNARPTSVPRCSPTMPSTMSITVRKARRSAARRRTTPTREGDLSRRCGGLQCLPASRPTARASDHGRQIARSFDADYLDRVRGYHETEDYKKAMRKRKVWIEPLFGEAKQWHGMRQFRLTRVAEGEYGGAVHRRGTEPEAIVECEGLGTPPVAGWSGRFRRSDRLGSLHDRVAHDPSRFLGNQEQLWAIVNAEPRARPQRTPAFSTRAIPRRGATGR